MCDIAYAVAVVDLIFESKWMLYVDGKGLHDAELISGFSVEGKRMDIFECCGMQRVITLE